MINFLKKFTFLQKILGLDNSGKVAKDRLRLVLIHDRSSISPLLMENLKFDLIKIISKYMVIDEESIEMGLDNKNGTVALAANIPILKIKADGEETQQLELPEERQDLKKTSPPAEDSSKEKLEEAGEPIKGTPLISGATETIKVRRRSYKNYRTKRKKRRISVNNF